jgi:LacI family transcriptional regulator
MTVTVTRLLPVKIAVTGSGPDSISSAARRVALVGFDDIELADLLEPGLTVVAQDAAALGRTAAERLFRQLDGTLLTPERIEIPTRLIARGSGELPPAD